MKKNIKLGELEVEVVRFTEGDVIATSTVSLMDPLEMEEMPDNE